MKAGSSDDVPVARVCLDMPADEAIPDEVEKLGARRVFVVASKTLARQTEVVSGIRSALGKRDVGLFDECREHTPLESVIACTQAVRNSNPDLILTIGGGTPIDTVKIVQLCLAHEIDQVGDLLGLAGKPTAVKSPIRQIVVPTTLSGGEYSSFAGGTDIVRRAKDMYYGPDLNALVVVLDPAVTLHTPEWLWLSTAMRALDHAIEGYCAPEANKFVQKNALDAMRLFSISLRLTKDDPSELEARQASQMASWLAALSLGRVSMGASHGIGYLLGAMFNVPHGYTSCVMLPAVLRWNEPVTSDLQADISAALGMPGAAASIAVSALLDDLGMPRRLRDIGVGPDRLREIAQRAISHPVVKSNPRPIRTVDDVLEILSLAL